jgi:hypothetical protein
MRTNHDDDDDFVLIDGVRCLKDGRRLRVSMMDATRARTATISHDARPAVGSVAAPFASRPGFITSDALDQARRESLAIETTRRALDNGLPAAGRPTHDTSTMSFADAQKIRDVAYAQMCDELRDAWRGDAALPVGAYPLSSGEGTACTINGAPGTLKRVGGTNWLVCQPTGR